MAVYLLSADGEWQWSPPGRLKLQFGTEAAIVAGSVLSAALRASRLKGSGWQLSMDGAEPIRPDAVLPTGSCVHLISNQTFVVSPLPPLAAFQLRVEAKAAQARDCWLELLHETCSEFNIMYGQRRANMIADLQEKAREKVRSRCCFFLPDKGFRMRWDLCQVVVLCAIAVLVEDIAIPPSSDASMISARAL